MQGPTAAWARRYAELLGVAAPSEEEASALLELAGVAAHASERTAAPLSTWLVARAGIAPSEGLALAEQLARQLAAESLDAGGGVTP